MPRLRWWRVPVLLLTGALVAGCSLDHESDLTSESGAEQPSETRTVDLRLDDAVDPQLFGTSDGLVLVASRLAGEDLYGGVVTSSYDGSWWTAPETLSSDGARTSGARVAINDSGVGVALWTESGPESDPATESQSEESPPVLARVRQPDGTWTPAERLGPLTYVDDVQVNARGDIAAIGSPDVGPRALVLRPAGGEWTVTPLPTEDTGSVSIDEEGGVHLATTTTSRGGGGPVRVSYLPAGGSWTVPQVVPVDRVATEPAQIVALPDGHEVLLVGTISTTWMSTFDTEYYWATDYRLLSRKGTSGPFVEQWSRDGATDLRAVRDGAGVRLVWTQDEDGAPAEGDPGTIVPNRQALLARGSDGAVVRLGEAAIQYSDGQIGGGLTFATGHGCPQAPVAWRTRDADGSPTELRARVARQTTSYADEGARPLWDVQASVTCSGAQGWLARSVGLEQTGSADAGNEYLSGGTVVVERLP